MNDLSSVHWMDKLEEKYLVSKHNGWRMCHWHELNSTLHPHWILMIQQDGWMDGWNIMDGWLDEWSAIQMGEWRGWME